MEALALRLHGFICEPLGSHQAYFHNTNLQPALVSLISCHTLFEQHIYIYDQPIQQIYHNPCGNSHFRYQLTTESAYYLVHTLNQLHFLGLPMTTPPRNPIFIVYHFAHYRIALATTYSSARYSLTDVRPIALLATVQYTKSILRRNSKSYPLSRITELNLTRRGRDEGSTNYSASDQCYHSLSTLSPFQKWGVQTPR